ncbi:MAG: DUF1150 family protein [Alphaproteobacteria bacterium]|jgi:hypothetical protein|nr:DUF1150 family protein [Alphaproteobacteria bacterium]MCB1550900.1 DUF1150 family protein [Alphaproteobacteria bacterium]MCB9985785.1 DUF1150 family protein [Micavibrio sp.]HRK97583.1 DUF1150 family protein [Alphaproteobacteria bacterium]
MKHEHQIELLKHLSPQAFLAFGMGQVAYIRPVTIENRKAYSLHAADGTALTLVDSLAGACVLARQNDLDPVVVQ